MEALTLHGLSLVAVFSFASVISSLLPVVCVSNNQTSLCFTARKFFQEQHNQHNLELKLIFAFSFAMAKMWPLVALNRTVPKIALNKYEIDNSCFTCVV